MARKLKTFQTSLGFYDLAIAVPSMKAALEAWGANSNLFHRGFAEESRTQRRWQLAERSGPHIAGRLSSYTAIKLSFSAQFFDTIGLALRIKSLPSCFFPYRPSVAKVHGRLVEDGLELCPI